MHKFDSPACQVPYFRFELCCLVFQCGELRVTSMALGSRHVGRREHAQLGKQREPSGQVALEVDCALQPC